MKTETRFFCGLILGLLSFSAPANNSDFTFGSGYPYLFVAEVSVASNENQQRWFANYKLGFDDGFSLGVEHGLGEEKKHAIGLFVGALGVSDADSCEVNNDPFGAVTLGCAFVEIFDDETTNGVGLSYTFNFNGLNNPGGRIRLEYGYGEGVDSGKERSDGNLTYSYQF